ncbi:MAG: Fur family transcriptional regulator [Bacteroidia bacterium]
MKVTRKTVAKTKILEYVQNSSSAVAHSDIQQSLKGICDRVTIYRVLDRLLSEGLVHKIVDVDGVVKYAACHTCEDEHHHRHDHVHFSCEKCKKVTCLDAVIPQLNMPKEYKINSVNFMVSGYCPNCKKSFNV